MESLQRHPADAIYGIQNAHVLKGIAAMKRISLPDLRGQLHLPT